jgi:hypothetical protein
MVFWPQYYGFWAKIAKFTARPFSDHDQILPVGDQIIHFPDP